MRTTHATNNRWNPFSWRAAELASLGDSIDDQARRIQLETELLMAEADEAARGALHLTVVHGDPPDLKQAIHLGHFYDIVKKLAVKAGMHRLRIEADHLIIAVSGTGTQECINQLAGVAEFMNPGYWRITRSARPDLVALVRR